MDETQPGGHKPGPYLKLPTGKFPHRTTIEVIQNNFPKHTYHGFMVSTPAVLLSTSALTVMQYWLM